MKENFEVWESIQNMSGEELKEYYSNQEYLKSMLIASCPLRISLFGGSTDNPYFVKEYGYGAVISFTCDLKTYVTISQDKIDSTKNNTNTSSTIQREKKSLRLKIYRMKL